MFCSNCGKELPDGSAFCSYCGGKQNVIYNTSAINTGQTDVTNNQGINTAQQYTQTNQQYGAGNNYMPESVVSHSIFDNDKEYIIHKGGAMHIRGMLSSWGRIELSNKKLSYYGRANYLSGLFGVFSFLFPVKLLHEIDLKDVSEVREGKRYFFRRTMIINAYGTYRYTVDYNMDYWLQVVNNAVAALKK